MGGGWSTSVGSTTVPVDVDGLSRCTLRSSRRPRPAAAGRARDRVRWWRRHLSVATAETPLECRGAQSGPSGRKDWCLGAPLAERNAAGKVTPPAVSSQTSLPSRGADGCTATSALRCVPAAKGRSHRRRSRSPRGSGRPSTERRARMNRIDRVCDRCSFLSIRKDRSNGSSSRRVDGGVDALESA